MTALAFEQVSTCVIAPKRLPRPALPCTQYKDNARLPKYLIVHLISSILKVFVNEAGAHKLARAAADHEYVTGTREARRRVVVAARQRWCVGVGGEWGQVAGWR